MYNGAQVWDLTPGKGAAAASATAYASAHTHGAPPAEPTRLQHYTVHKSIAYGVDWAPIPSARVPAHIGSCSFYDHEMHVWPAAMAVARPE